MLLDDKKYLTPNEVAKLLMISPITVRSWAQKGDLNALTTPGGHRRFLPGEIERFARQKNLTFLPDDSNGDTGQRILIVDDEPFVAELIDDILAMLITNITSKVVYDGFAAGMEMMVFKPHIVILDLLMPGIDGVEVCRNIKNDPKLKTTKVIGITSDHNNINIGRIMAAGAETCLTKPIKRNALKLALGIESKDTSLACHSM